MNLDSWNRLPKDCQDLMLEAQLQHERDWPAVYDKQNKEAWQKCLDAGVQIIKISPEERDKALKDIYEMEWTAIIKKYPDIGLALSKLFSK
jgi:TRAP-type C4-dicarboxylate transport system substrate-binding protein